MRNTSFLLVCLLYLFGCSKNDTPSTAQQSDTLMYERQNYSYNEGNCNDTTAYGVGKCAELQISFPIINQAESADAINEVIQHSILGMQFSPDTVATVDELRDAFFTSYKQSIQEFPEAMPNWTSERKVEIILNKFPLLSLQTSVHEYLGGAHPNSYVALSMFDTRNGKLLTFDDIIISDKKNALIAMVEKEFRLQKKLSPQEDLSERFFFEKDVFHLPENISCTKDGVLFFYNNYEVASYAEGQTEIVISYANMKPFLQQNTALWEYITSVKKK